MWLDRNNNNTNTVTVTQTCSHNNTNQCVGRRCDLRATTTRWQLHKQCKHQLCRHPHGCLALCQVDSCDMCGDRDVPVCPAITRMGVPVSQSVTKILQLPAPPLMRTEDRVDVSCMNIRSLMVPSWKISSVSQPKQTSAQCHNLNKHQFSVTT